MKKSVFLCLIAISIEIASFGQPAPARYGKIDIADLEMKVYDKDTSAEAVILCDYGEFNATNFNFTRLLRMKVLKKEGSDYVTQVLDIDGLSSIKGCTYNLVNGEVVETKLKNESIFKEELYEDRYRYRVTMPDVKVGSVVELQYSFPMLPNEWRFQDRIPVRWSELRIATSPYVTFQKAFFGFEPLYINEFGRWVGKDMPAFRSESYLNSYTNYINKVEIELSSVTVPNYYRFYTTSWDAVNKYLLNHKYFGVAMSSALFLGDDIRTIKALNLPELARMKAACERIKQKMKWNEEESLTTTLQDLGSTYRKGSGNSADINLSLVLLLKKLDFDAFPVALSTRQNGLVSPAFPTIDKLNYVVAGVKYDGKYYVFDATERYLPAGMLPFRALNGRGRIINYEFSDWVDLAPKVDQKEVIYCDMKLGADGVLSGKMTYTDLDYEAYYFRNEYKSYNSKDEYTREVEGLFPGLTINSLTCEDLDSLSKPVKEIYDVTLSGYADNIGEMISLSPMLIEKMESNPFKMEFRKYPIDYGHPIKSRFVLNLEIPEGYEVTDIPKACNIGLPDKSARYTYYAVLNGNKLQLASNFEINRTVYDELQYVLVKEFYNQVIAKQKEVIMLKKKT